MQGANHELHIDFNTEYKKKLIFCEFGLICSDVWIGLLIVSDPDPTLQIG
jgi:hypothetical protein